MDEYAKLLAGYMQAHPYLSETGTGMSLSDYEALKKGYYDANPYKGDASTYYGADALSGGWAPEATIAEINRPQDQWNDQTYQDWLGRLTPEQQAEYKAQVHERYKSEQGKMRLAMAAAMAGMGGLGALGAGAAEGGAGIGTLGGLDALPAGLGTIDASGFAAIPEIAGGGAGLSSSAAGLGGVGGLGSEWLGGLGQLGGLGGAGGAAGAAGGGNLLETILAGAKGIGGSTNWTNLLGNLAGGLIQSRASGKATDALVNAGNQSNALLERMWQQSRADQAPYREAGTSALAGIQALLKDPSSISQMPDYQFGLDQGTKALANSAAARGMTYSGQQGKALQRYGQDYAGTKLNDSYNRLASIAGIGQQATNQTGALGAQYGGQMANTIQGIGNAQGSGYVGRGNAWNNAIGGALNGLSEQNLIDALLKRGGG